MNIDFRNIKEAYKINNVPLIKIYASNNLLLWEKKEPIVYTDCITFKSANPFTLSIYTNSRGWDGTLEYSTDYINWAKWNATTLSSGLYDGINKLHVRGYNNTRITYLNKTWILTGSDIECEGDIRTLLNYNNVNNITISTDAFEYMFKGNESLISAPELLVPSVKSGYYESMFEDCINLSKGPSTLPANKIYQSSYAKMFKNCLSLTEAPEILATQIDADAYQACWQMFYGCESLMKVQEKLYSTTLSHQCYAEMFRGCTSLTTAPELPALTLAIDCYIYMFKNCEKLNYIKMLAIDKPSDRTWEYCLSGWTDGVAARGTFVKSSSNTSLSNNVNGIPQGWTVRNVYN